LVLDHDARRIVERLRMRGDLERLEQILAGQLVGEPGRPGVRAHHRRREQVHGGASYADPRCRNKRYAAADGGGVHARPVSTSTCASRTPAGAISIVPRTIGSENRRGPIDPGLNTVSPLSTPMNGTCEWPHTTSDAPAARARRATSARIRGPATAIWIRRIRSTARPSRVISTVSASGTSAAR